jgi:hypothetical protein
MMDIPFTYCAFCGAEFPCDDDASEVAVHIRTCEKHPMRGLENCIRLLKSRIEICERIAAERENAIISLNNELGAIDSVLARRDALDNEPTRVDKILKCINTAKRADDLQREIDGRNR